MKKNKKIMWIAVLGVLVAGLMIISLMTKKGKQDEAETRPPPTRIEEKKLPIVFDLPQPKGVNWNLTGGEWTEGIDRLSMETTEVKKETISSLLKLVGLRDGEETIKSREMTTWSDGERRTAYYYSKNKSFGFTEAITARSQINEAGIASGDIIGMIEKAVKPEGVKLKVVSREYKKIVNPRWVTTTAEEAEAIEIRANYFWNDYPLFGFTGEPIVVIVNLKGKILKMEVELIGRVTAGEKIKLIGKDELARVGADGVWVWRSEAAKGENEDETIGEVNVKTVSLGYIYNQSGVVGEYLIGEGNGIKGSLPGKMTVIVPASK